MDAIPGFRTKLSDEEFIHLIKTTGLVLAGQTADLAPADGKLYSLRDVTGTVPSIPLIASSIMSKKIAGGAHAIVLDVKVGLGAFMKNLEDARQLSHLMVSIGHLSGRKVIALLSDMNQPLGNAVGNALEVKEAIATLHGKGPADFTEHCVEVASQMLLLGEKAASLEEARKMVLDTLQSGRSWEQFRKLVINQGGDVSCVDDPEKLARAKFIETVTAPRSGYLKEINAQTVGETSVELGAGRVKKSDVIDPAVGIIIHHKVGDALQKGDALFTIHANDEEKLANARERLLGAHLWSDEKVEPLPLFYGVIK
jgi:pyrimidine-nucleoside phosphorylase